MQLWYIDELRLFQIIRWTPESPRLRLTQGRVEEAEEIIKRVMRSNKREIPDDFRQDIGSI